jgi:hypothetical protein
LKRKPLAAIIIIIATVAAGGFLMVRLQNRGVVARVNGAPIDEQQLEGMLDTFKPDGGWEGVGQKEVLMLKREMLSLLIDEELLHQEALKRGIEIPEEDLQPENGEEWADRESKHGAGEKDFSRWRREREKKLLIESLIAREVNSKVKLAEAEAREYYRAHREEFTLYPMVKVYHIFLKDERRAKELREELTRGRDFEELARRWSQSPEAEKGGDLGLVRKGDLPEAMEDQIFKMSPGEISPVVKSAYGYHIFKVTEVIESDRDDFQSFRDKITATLLRQKRRELLQSWLTELRGKARIVIYDKRLL